MASETPSGSGGVVAAARRRATSRATRCGSGRSSHGHLEERRKQVTERGECEARLDLARLCGDDPKATFPGSLDPGRPERGLADARLAGEKQQPRAGPDDRVEKPLDLIEFSATAQDR